MADVTFRDFAGAVMRGDTVAGASALEVLLGLDASTAASATSHFQAQMATGPAFMGKAMGLRTAVTSGSDEQLSALLVECFGLTEPALGPAITTLRAKYPTGS